MDDCYEAEYYADRDYFERNYPEEAERFQMKELSETEDD